MTTWHTFNGGGRETGRVVGIVHHAAFVAWLAGIVTLGLCATASGQPVGACCGFMGQPCVELTQAACAERLGVWHEGVTCAQADCSQPWGGCCHPDGTCTDLVSLADCLASGGHMTLVYGFCEEANCDPTPTGACCHNDGTCSENVTRANCQATGGAWHESSTCVEAGCMPAPPLHGNPAWLKTPPESRYRHAMAYDSVRGVTVLFGGRRGTSASNSVTNETREWNGSIWTLRNFGGPSAREGHAMAYDATRHVAVMFGGSDAGGNKLGDTWEWNGAAWALRASSGPSPRWFHAMAYDTARQVTVLFGGSDANGYNGETWEWDGTGWALSDSDGPSPREMHAMAYDSVRGVTVLFGGSDNNGSSGATWEWDGGGWTLAATTSPSPRHGMAMVYDNVRQLTMLYGGDTGTYNFIYETWAWNGNTWVLSSTHGFLSGSEGVAMVYDAARGVAVRFGGLDFVGNSGQPQPTGDTSEWNGSEWAYRSYSAPSGRYSAAMAYDSVRRVTVLFGGKNFGTPYVVNGETWEWDGMTWALRSSTGPAPRSGAAMAYDVARHETLLMGGYDANNLGFAEFWAWNGNTWVSRPMPSSSISSPALAYDNGRGVTVMVAKETGYPTQTYCQTREWDGTNWTQPLAHGPQSRSGHVMAYDVRRGVTVLHGGWWGTSDQVYGDTWEWNGTRWYKRSNYWLAPSTTCMAYDAKRGVTVAFGGEDYMGEPHGGTWEWDGNTWTNRTLAEPPARTRAAMAYDAARGEIVMFGGRVGTLNNPIGLWESDETWTLRTAGRSIAKMVEPAIPMTVDEPPGP